MDRLLLLLPTTTYRTAGLPRRRAHARRRHRLRLREAEHLRGARPRSISSRSTSPIPTAPPPRWPSSPPPAAARRRRRGRPDHGGRRGHRRAARLRANAVAAVAAARDKFQMRQCLAAAGVPIPRFRRIALKDDPFLAARGVQFPCVLKPLALSASRGVIRANNVDQFMAAFRRIAALLARDDVEVSGDAAQYPARRGVRPRPRGGAGRPAAGRHAAHAGALRQAGSARGPVLRGDALRHALAPARRRAAAPSSAWRRAACTALGLVEGPVHAELRFNDAGPWVLEVAARSIGGLCSRTLRFGTGMTLEEIILRHALGWPIETLTRERRPAGVMMIPIPRAGRLQAVRGRGSRAVGGRRGRCHAHRPRRPGAGAAARGLALPRIHLRARGHARRRRGGAARRARPPEVRDRLAPRPTTRTDPSRFPGTPLRSPRKFLSCNARSGAGLLRVVARVSSTATRRNSDNGAQSLGLSWRKIT